MTDSLSSFVQEAAKQQEQLRQLSTSSFLQEAVRAQEQLRRLSTSSALQEIAKQQERLRQVVSSSAVAAFLQEIAKQQEQLRQVVSSSAVAAFLQEIAKQQERLRQVVSSSAVAAFLQEIAKQQEQLRQVVSSSAVAAFLQETAKQQEQFRRLTLHAVSQIQLQDIYIEGAISLGNESIPSLEVDEAISDIVSHIGEPEFFEIFIERLNALREPVQTIVVWLFKNVVLPLIINISVVLYQPDIQLYFDSLKFNSKIEIKREIKKLSYEESKKNFSKLRIVTAQNGLHIRSKPDAKSRSIGILNIGKSVKEIEKHNKWILVEVTPDGSDKIVQGWIFSKYTLTIR